MKKKILAGVFFLFTAAFALAQKGNAVIWYTVVQKAPVTVEQYYDHFAPEDLARDLADLLEKSTGIKFSTQPYDGKSQSGFLLLIDSTKRSLANEAAIVNADGKSFVRITAKYATGVSFAMYTYLDKMGFKFYLPGDNWTVIPKLDNIYSLKISNEEWKPYFKIRSFFSSGAMRPVKDLDPGNVNFKTWNKWYQRNRMGSEYTTMGGHIGELFNMEHQKEIEQDPMMLAPTNGKRAYNIEGKLDPTYDKGVNTFVDWIIQQYKKDNRNVPTYLPYSKYQSVDPGDGLNYCHSPECEKRYGSISNQVFTIANKAAISIRKKYPDAGVNLYAYTERSDTPSIKIEGNVHVCIVASAFQTVGTPAGLIKRWADKTKHASIYDYLNICVWTKDHPFFDMDGYFQYLNYIKKQQLEGFSFESGNSSIGSGIIQYFVLKYLNTPYADVKKEFSSFCKDMFGNAVVPIQKMLEEWLFYGGEKIGHTYDRITYNEVELGRYLKYIQEASNAAGLTAVQKQRIFELKAYVVYLVKYFELAGDIQTAYLNKNSAAYTKAKTDEILNYTWMLYPSMIFHNTQLTDVLKGNFGGDDALNKKWDYNYSDNFKNITKDADKKVETEFSRLFAKYAPSGRPFFSDINALLTKAYPYRADTILLKLIDAGSYVNYRNSFEVYCNEPTTISVRYKANPERPVENKNNSLGFISLLKDDYSVINEYPVYPGKTEGTINFVLPQKGNYKLYLGQVNATDFDYTILPGKTLFYINKFIIPMNGILVMDDADRKYKTNDKLAFYTADADSINYSMIYADKGDYLSVYSSNGVKKQMTNYYPPYHIATKLEQVEKNSFMYFTNGLFRWPPAFKTIPNYFFYFKYPLKPKTN